jgi:hypothetical protein
MNSRGGTVRVARAKKPLAGFKFRFERLRLAERCGRALTLSIADPQITLFQHSLLCNPRLIVDRKIRHPLNLFVRLCNRFLERTAGIPSPIFRKSAIPGRLAENIRKTQAVLKGIRYRSAGGFISVSDSARGKVPDVHAALGSSQGAISNHFTIRRQRLAIAQSATYRKYFHTSNTFM